MHSIERANACASFCYLLLTDHVQSKKKKPNNELGSHLNLPALSVVSLNDYFSYFAVINLPNTSGRLKLSKSIFKNRVSSFLREKK